MGLISITEYAIKHGIAPVTARQKAAREGYTTAKKIGNTWLIDEDEPNYDNRRKMKIDEKIDRAIDEKAMNTGAMGSEVVTVTLELTAEEKDFFHSIEKYDNEHYSWDFEENVLTISYTEDI